MGAGSREALVSETLLPRKIRVAGCEVLDLLIRPWPRVGGSVLTYWHAWCRRGQTPVNRYSVLTILTSDGAIPTIWSLVHARSVLFFC
jgi:hypothetical protein